MMQAPGKMAARLGAERLRGYGLAGGEVVRLRVERLRGFRLAG